MMDADRGDKIESWVLPLADGAQLEVESDAFALRIEPVSPGGVPRVEAQVRNGRVPEVEVHVDGARVSVEIRHPSNLVGVFGWWPWVGRGERITLFLPRDIHARVTTGAGAVRARDLDGCDVELATSAGAISVQGIHGRMRLHTAAGAIEGHDLGGSFDVETAAGSVRLGIVALANGTHRVHSAAGSVRIDLDAGIQVDVTGDTEFGSNKIEYPSTPGAPARLLASTTAGSIRVRTATAPVAAVLADRLNEVSGAGPYRRAAVPAVGAGTATAAGELERVLEMVAQGKLSPTDAGDLLRAMGHR